MDYGFVHDGKVFTPNATQGISVDENAARNKAIEQAELEEWRGKPEWFAGYVAKKVITSADPTAPEGSLRRHEFYQWRFTTWLGTDLGQAFVNSTWRNNLTGYKVTAITVVGNNGATYHGRYGSDWSHLCRVRKRKVESGGLLGSRRRLYAEHR